MSLFGESYKSKFNRESTHQKEMLQREQDFTERMWNQTNDWNLAQWNRENEYNTPEAQMQRFLDAGINPNNAAQAIAGSDSSAGSFSASVPGSPTAPSAPSPVGTDAIGNMTSLANTVMGIGRYIDSERQNIDADTELKNKQSGETDSKRLLNEQERQNLAEQLRGLVIENTEIKPKQVKEIEANIWKLTSSAELDWSTREKVIEEAKNMREEFKLLQKRQQELEQAIKESKERIELLKKQQEELGSEIELNRANAGKASAEAQVAREEAALKRLQQDKQDLDNEYQDMVNGFEGYLQSVGTSTVDKRSTPEKVGNNLGSAIRDKNGKDVIVTRGRQVRSKYRSQNHRNPSSRKNGGVR